MRGTEHLHPELQVICEKFLNYCQLAGLNVKITDTLRTKAEQDEAYAQGRTKPGSIITNVQYPNSAHCWGVAFDICQNIKGREYDDSDNFFAKCGKIGESLGLTWGGSWKSFVDKPHFEMTKYMPNSSTKWLRETYTDPQRFMETWAREEETEGEEMRFKHLTDVPNDNGFRDIIAELMNKGIIKGTGKDSKGDIIDLSYDMLRMIVFLYRAGVFSGR
jgi:peptidoglycan L-alanyl-D-glutamate endopeptidase CwlK